MTNPSDFTKYIPAAWRVYQHLDEVRSLQERAAPHLDFLMGLAPEARQLYAAIFPEEGTNQADRGKFTFTVSQLQEALNSHSAAKLKVDGKYGSSTKKAVEDYQHEHGLEVDGWAGLETLGHLFNTIAQAK
jgi:murein L,D-transpeptidase YcbB/YkuD